MLADHWTVDAIIGAGCEDPDQAMRTRMNTAIIRLLAVSCFMSSSSCRDVGKTSPDPDPKLKFIDFYWLT